MREARREYLCERVRVNNKLSAVVMFVLVASERIDDMMSAVYECLSRVRNDAPRTNA